MKHVAQTLAALFGFSEPAQFENRRVMMRGRRDLVMPKCDPSQYSTLRHDQVERRRKRQKKTNHKMYARYRRARGLS